MSTSRFHYTCRCGATGLLVLDRSAARCTSCGFAYPVSKSGIIFFTREATEQNEYFDSLYQSGKFHKIDETGGAQRNSYRDSTGRAQHYLSACGVDLAAGLSGASILDIACGSGWVTAGLMSHPKIQKCRFHASDISPDGLEMLAVFRGGLVTSSLLEMSVQNAEQMMFADATFDFVIGSSVLHHFRDVPAFLGRCRRILTGGGIATFGEPFAVGYGIGSAILTLAQRQLGTSHAGIGELYNDMLVRVAGPPEGREKLVDKHLFFHSTFISMARQAGFSEVEFHPFASRQFYRESFMDELLAERGIQDAALARAAKEMYRVIFDIFDADTYGHSLSAFNQIVLRA